MASENHTITIDLDGTVEIAVSGIKGKGCKDATAQLEKALGVTISDTETREYYEPEQTTDRRNRQ